MRGENRKEGILTAKLAKLVWDHTVLLGDRNSPLRKLT